LTDLGRYLFDGLKAVAVVLGPEAEIAFEAASAIFEVSTSLASDLTTDKPLSDEIKAKVDDLATQVADRLFSSVNAMDRVRDVVNSDYGRLRSLGTLAGWKIDRPTLAGNLTDAANTFFSSQIMPVAYGVYALVGNDDPETCRDAEVGHTWRGAPASAQMEWLGGYDLDGYKNNRGRFILGQHSLSIRYYAYPPANLTDQMFSPPTTRQGWVSSSPGSSGSSTTRLPGLSSRPLTSVSATERALFRDRRLGGAHGGFACERWRFVPAFTGV
jgi:hypothetical protein